MPPKRLLLDQCQQDKQTPSKKPKKETWKRLKRRDTDEQVKEAATRHLGDADDIDLHHKKVDGVTLHDTMVEYKRLSKMTGSNKGGRFSAKYMASLREKFGVKSLLEELVVADASESTQKELVNALDFSTKKNLAQRTRQPLQTFFEHCVSLNQKEVIGIVRHMMSLRIGGNKKTRDLVLSCMKMVQRLVLAEKFKHEFQFVRVAG